MAMMALAASFLVLLLASHSVYGTDHTVGDSNGWTLGGDYTTWASGKTFSVGDNLVFKYDSSHALDIVDKNGYDGCSSSNSQKSYSDGNTKVALNSPGNMYFICPQPGHCAGGMKLSINVVAASNTPSGGSPSPTTPSPSGGTSPTTPSSPSTPTTTRSPSPPPPPSNGAVNVVAGGVTNLMGSLFVSATVLGFMMG